jgi:ABC-type bacteriocin/lantibiotic exporter with double-glycine peptidase domain
MKNSISDFLSSPEIQSFLENNILKPLLDKVFSYLYPYLLGIMSLWIIMFLCTIMILVLLLKTGFTV